MLNDLPSSLRRIVPSLSCPSCANELIERKGCFECSCCKNKYIIKNGTIFFITPPEANDEFDRIKGKLKKRLGKIYYSVGVKIFSPDYPFNFMKELFKHVDPKQKIIVDLGAGANKIHPDIVSIDLFYYKSVNIVCDISNLPFKDNSIDVFISSAVLEHVPRPWDIIDHLYKKTTNEGLGFHLMPFLAPFHASPYDFCRFTHKGIESLFKEWEIIDIKNVGGPCSLVLSIMIDFLSTLFSFSSTKLKSILYLTFCGFLFPIKFLDFFFIKNKKYIGLAPLLFWKVKK